MFKNVKNHLFLPFVFWLLVFAFFKILFLGYHFSKIRGESFIEIFKALIVSLRLDASTITFIMAFPFLALIIQWFMRKKWLDKFLSFYHFILIVLFSFLSFSDIVLYEHWSSRINMKIVDFLGNWEMAFSTAGTPMLVGGFLLLGVVIFTIYLLFKRFFHRRFIFPNINPISSSLFFLLGSGLIIIGMRGGLQEIPINQSDAFYSSNPTLNIVGVNSLWNLGNVLYQNKNALNTNIYKKMPEDKAALITNNIFEKQNGSHQKWTNLENPNVIVVMMEGINANVLKDVDYTLNYMPSLSEMIEDGLLFNNFYSNAMRTDQGLINFIAGFPTLPENTIGAQPEKFQKLPSITELMQTKNYQSSFFFAGEPEFGSLKSFLVHNHFSPIVDYKNFPKYQRTQKLGAPDEFLFQYHLDYLSKLEQPFFSILLTQTSHEPFDMPFNKNVYDHREKYLNTVQYLDSVIGNWWQEIKQTSIYNNTIFIITSDHGHRFPGRYDFNDIKRFQIPFIVLSKHLYPNLRGKKMERLSSQMDISCTLLAQLDLPCDDFYWSRDLMDSATPEQAFFVYHNGFVWQTPSQLCSYEYNFEKVSYAYPENIKAPCIEEGQAIMQHLFQQYMDY